jgi:hypothetical protein
MRRFLQVRQPVLVLFLILGFDADAAFPLGGASSGPPEDGAAGWTFAIASKNEEAGQKRDYPERVLSKVKRGYKRRWMAYLGIALI